MNEKNDKLGKALLDFQKGKQEAIVEVCSEGFDNDYMDVSYYFRDLDEMPELEQKAMSLVKGKTMEIGAGAGSHSLYLQEKGLDVYAIDISPGAVEVMKERGLKKVRCMDFYDLKEEKYDTLLLLMNGIGIAGTLSNLSNFIKRLTLLLRKNGQILVDSTDLRYLYENEDGSFYMDLNAPYYGELNFRFKYNGENGDWFPWLYIDADKLKEICSNLNCKMEIVFNQDDYHYLAMITQNDS